MNNTNHNINLLPTTILNDLEKDWNDILKKSFFSDSYQKFLEESELSYEKECDEFSKLPTIKDNFLYIQKLKPHEIVDVVDSGIFDLKSLSNYISFEFSKKSSDLKRDTILCFGITINSFTGNTLENKILRVLDGKIVYKKLNKLYEQWKECFNNHKLKQDYISKSCFLRMKNKKIKQNEFLKSKYIFCSGKSGLNFNDIPVENFDDKRSNIYNLFEVQEKARNSKLSQIYATSLSMQNVARKAGYRFLFATITCPSKFHIKSKTWDNKSVADSNDFLRKVWRNITKRINESDFKTYGAWTKEAHKDATLHQHALFFVNENNIFSLRKIILNSVRYAFAKENEKFIYNISVNFKSGDAKAEEGSGNASVASYVFKYISKSFTSKSDELTAIDAHSMQFSYRRYAFFGIERCATVWQYLFKFKKYLISMKNVMIKI
ncbi:replication endonuclease [Shewanella xiamenensis]|uniref:replication endonuclease n=1 Tax=Shewanella xiamenensis TaxID=332186 RepID=UPI002949DE7B|nr:replication endonuclease [Shewanella xiamenensis]MDV5246064.1 replication endonuclease [Shewanella xiamenensis]